MLCISRDRGDVAVCCRSGAFQQHPNIKQLKPNLKMLHLQMNMNENGVI